MPPALVHAYTCLFEVSIEAGMGQVQVKLRSAIVAKFRVHERRIIPSHCQRLFHPQPSGRVQHRRQERDGQGVQTHESPRDSDESCQEPLSGDTDPRAEPGQELRSGRQDPPWLERLRQLPSQSRRTANTASAPRDPAAPPPRAARRSPRPQHRRQDSRCSCRRRRTRGGRHR